MSTESRPRRALLSAYDKTGVVELGAALVELGWELVSSGGTAKVLADAGLPVIPSEQVTGFGEMLGGEEDFVGGETRLVSGAPAKGRHTDPGGAQQLVARVTEHGLPQGLAVHLAVDGQHAVALSAPAV